MKAKTWFAPKESLIKADSLLAAQVDPNKVVLVQEIKMDDSNQAARELAVRGLVDALGLVLKTPFATHAQIVRDALANWEKVK